MPGTDEGVTGSRAHARRYLITGSIPVMPFVFWHYLCGVTLWKGAAEKFFFFLLPKSAENGRTCSG
jgi:hypothetical protein